MNQIPVEVSAPRGPDHDVVGGVTVADPYRWLEDPAHEGTAEWSAAQEQHFSSHQSRWSSRTHFRERVEALLNGGYHGVPIWRGDRKFYMRRLPGQEHGVLLTVDPDGSERVLFDPMESDPTGLTTLDSWQPSKEGHLLAYQVSEGGREESVLRVMQVDTCEVIDGPVDRARYSPVAWLPGGDAYYYVRRLPADQVPAGEEQFHRRVWFHRVGTDHNLDVMVFGEGLTATNYYGVSVSMDGSWLTVSASEGTAPRNDVWIAPLADPEAPGFRPVHVGIDAQTSPRFGRDGRMYIFTDFDAPRGRLCVTDPEHPEPEHWQTLVPEDATAVLADYAIIDELDRPLLLCTWSRHAVSEVTIHDLRTGERLGDLPMPGVGSTGGIVERPEGGHEGWFSYTDHVTPTRIFHIECRGADGSDLLTESGEGLEVSVWATPPGTVDVPAVHTEQVVYTSADGTEVRLFVVSPTSLPDAPRPTVLYGYGGFGISMTPGFSAGILSWVEAGGVYAVACLRGGGEEGEQWHRDGMLGKKQNVFDDFHAAAEWLIAEGWTTPDQLAISGGSNGGLLVGAALTQRPDLYRAVVCSAPLLDMVRYEKFGLGATWNVEYGSASVDAEAEWLLSYSPYHHVRDGVRYPTTLFTVFEGDTRVDPLHARKMCAALQHSTTGGPVLIRAEAEVGHGARSVTRSLDLSADTLAFMADATGLEVPMG